MLVSSADSRPTMFKTVAASQSGSQSEVDEEKSYR